MGWAAGLGYNTVRVFLHDLLMEEGDAFLDRVDEFLAIANDHNVGAMLVLFDGCWDPRPRLGAQPDPRPRIHNSRWVQSPGAAVLVNLAKHEDRLRRYVQRVLRRFANDTRVVTWDLFNEADNGNIHNYGYFGKRVPAAVDAKGTELRPLDKAVAARRLLEKALGWAREVSPSQPITMPVYNDATGDEAADAVRASTFNWTLSVVDIITFHEYRPLDSVADVVRTLQALGRPLACSEYMARTTNSTFDPVLGFLEAKQVWAINWGFVAGRSQTIFPWDSWNVPYPANPPLWHHDVLLKDGTPYRAAEAIYIRNHTERVVRTIQ